MKIIPRNNQVLVKQDPEPTRESELGIITPSNVEQETNAFGLIEAIGDTVDNLKVGDHVIYGKFAGETIEFEKEKITYKLLAENEILAFYEI